MLIKNTEISRGGYLIVITTEEEEEVLLKGLFLRRFFTSLLSCYRVLLVYALWAGDLVIWPTLSLDCIKNRHLKWCQKTLFARLVVTPAARAMNAYSVKGSQSTKNAFILPMNCNAVAYSLSRADLILRFLCRAKHRANALNSTTYNLLQLNNHPLGLTTTHGRFFIGNFFACHAPKPSGSIDGISSAQL